MEEQIREMLERMRLDGDYRLYSVRETGKVLPNHVKPHPLPYLQDTHTHTQSRLSTIGGRHNTLYWRLARVGI